MDRTPDEKHISIDITHFDNSVALWISPPIIHGSN